VSIVIGYDATHANIGSLPRGAQVAGYSTGTGSVPWTAADWAAHPGALRICQDSQASDTIADYLDVELNAATPGVCARWAKAALANWTAATRPGQRKPAIYMSASTVTTVVNALIAGGVRSGVGLVVANWNLTQAQAVAQVAQASGPFPIVGIQFRDPGPYDVNVFSGEWLAQVSGYVRHVSEGLLSLRQVAAARGMTFQEAARRSLESLNVSHAAAFREYYDVPGGADDIMPRGLVYWL
jgi:hypothetical protein